MLDDIIIYTNHSQTQDLLLFAKELGCSVVGVFFEKHDKKNKELFEKLAVEGLELKKGLLVSNQKDIQKVAQHYDFLLGIGERGIIEDKKTNYVYGAETLETKDKTHQRGSGLNQVTAKLLAERDKTYVFCVSDLLEGGYKQAQILGRMQQNKRFLEKYSVKMVVWSLAKDRLGLRGAKERKHFLKEL